MPILNTRLGAALERLLGRRRPGQAGPPAPDKPGADFPDMPQGLRGAGNPESPGGVATVDQSVVRPGATAGMFPARASNPVPRPPPSSGIDQQRPESSTQAARIQAWNAYRRAEKAAGRGDPGQYSGQ